MTQISRRNFVADLGIALGAGAVVTMTGCGSETTTTTAASSSSDSKKASDSAAESAASESGEYKLVEAGKLTIGCSPDYPPMEYQDGDAITGFTAGLMQEISDRLGLECNFLSAQNFDTLVTQVAAGTKMDVAASSITINDEREESVDFSDPYYDSNLAIVVLKNSEYASRDDLDGLPVGAQSGSTGEEWVKENMRDNPYTPYTQTVDALAALRTGDVNAVVYDEPVARNHVSNEYDDCEILEVIATGEQYGIAINKENTALRDDINAALADMKADGTMDELMDTWIGKASEGKVASSASSAASEKAEDSSSSADKD